MTIEEDDALNLILAKGLTRLQGARFGMSAELAAKEQRAMVLSGHSLARPRSAAARTSTSPEAAATYSVLRGGFRWPAKTHGAGVRAALAAGAAHADRRADGAARERVDAHDPAGERSGRRRRRRRRRAAGAAVDGRRAVGTGGPLLAAATSVLQHPARFMCDARPTRRSVLHGCCARAAPPA